MVLYTTLFLRSGGKCQIRHKASLSLTKLQTTMSLRVSLKALLIADSEWVVVHKVIAAAAWGADHLTCLMFCLLLLQCERRSEAICHTGHWNVSGIPHRSLLDTWKIRLQRNSPQESERNYDNLVSKMSVSGQINNSSYRRLAKVHITISLSYCICGSGVGWGSLINLLIIFTIDE